MRPGPLNRAHPPVGDRPLPGCLPSRPNAARRSLPPLHAIAPMRRVTKRSINRGRK